MKKAVRKKAVRKKAVRKKAVRKKAEMKNLLRWTLMGALAVGGCDGVIDDAGAAPEPGPLEPNPDPNGDGIPDPFFHFSMLEPATFPGVRMMTNPELSLAVLELTGETPDLSGFPEALSLFNLDNDAGRTTVRDARHMRGLFEVAHRVALDADLGQALPCAGDPCTDAEVSAFLSRAFVDDPGEDLSTYRGIYSTAAQEKGHDFGRRALIQAALLSPRFLYRTEIGNGGAALTSAELGKKLSFFLWGGPPDSELRSAALDGSLTDPAVYAGQVDRLIADDRTKAQATEVLVEWLGRAQLKQTANADFDALPAGIEDSMKREVELLIADVLDRDAPLSELFSATDTFVNGDLAAHYGIEGISGNDFERVSLDGTERQGILTTALVLAAHAKEDGRSPMQRGHFLVNELMCHSFPSAAGMAAMELPQGDGTFRERFAILEEIAPCTNCHRTLNAGFAFDIFDPVGRRWENDEVPMADTVGFYDLPPFERVEFSNTSEAIAGLGSHPAIPRCFVAQSYRFAQGRLPGTQDREVLEELTAGFETDQNILQLFRSIVLSEAFRSVLSGGGR